MMALMFFLGWVCGVSTIILFAALVVGAKSEEN